MNQLLSVARVDLRRFGRMAVGLGVLVGVMLAGSWAWGRPRALWEVAVQIMPMIGGIAFGVTHGSEIASGRAAFLFARPVLGSAIYWGRFLAATILTLTSVLIALGIYRVVSGQPTLSNIDDAAPLVSLMFFLIFCSSGAVAAELQQGRVPDISLGRRLREWASHIAFTTALLLMIALLLDFSDRVIEGKRTMAYLVLGPLALAHVGMGWFTASRGQSDGPRASRTLQFSVATSWTALGLTWLGIWLFVLHPTAASIDRLAGVTPLPDGQRAFVRAVVPRLAWNTEPAFVVDLQTGKAERFAKTKQSPPAWSRHGQSWAWISDAPRLALVVKNIFRSTPLQHRGPSGEMNEWPTPSIHAAVPNEELNVRLSDDGEWILSLHKRWIRRRDGTLLNVPEESLAFIQSTLFLPGRLLVARLDTALGLVFEELTLPAGSRRTLAALPDAKVASVQFRDDGTLALVLWGAEPRRQAISLVELSEGTQRVLSPAEGGGLTALFLSDGGSAIARSGFTGGARLTIFDAQHRERAPVLVFSQIGFAPALGEVEPGVLAVSDASRTEIVDLATLAVKRSLPGLRYVSGRVFGDTSLPPPGSPGAHVFQGANGFVLADVKTGAVTTLLGLVQGASKR